MRLMKPVALALLFVLLPTAVLAQTPTQPQKSSGKKLKWIALGSVIAGAGLGAAAAFSGGKTMTTPLLSPSGVTSTVSACTQVACPATIGVVGGVGIPLAPPTGVGGAPSSPAAAPGTLGMFGAPTTLMTLQPQYQRKTNWKLIAPAIGAATAGGFLLYRYHVRGKNADVSLRQDGAVQFAVRW